MERKWLTAPSAEDEAPALLPVLGVLRKALCDELASAWLMWVKEELLRGRRSREACAEMEDIAGGAREERGLY